MRFVLLPLLAVFVISCDAEPTEYPFLIPDGDLVVTHTWNGDSLSIAKINKVNGGRMGRSQVNQITGFGPEDLFISFEPDGSASMAYEEDNAWIALPTTEGAFVTNQPRDAVSLGTESRRIESTSRCVRSVGPSTSAIIVIESTLRTFDLDDSEIWSKSWTDSVWWSRKHGMISKLRYRFAAPHVQEWEIRCQFPDGFMEID
jgi:hypothetical protein